MGRIRVEYCQWSISDSTLYVCMHACMNVVMFKTLKCMYVCVCVLTIIERAAQRAATLPRPNPGSADGRLERIRGSY